MPPVTRGNGNRMFEVEVRSAIGPCHVPGTGIVFDDARCKIPLTSSANIVRSQIAQYLRDAFTSFRVWYVKALVRNNATGSSLLYTTSNPFSGLADVMCTSQCGGGGD